MTKNIAMYTTVDAAGRTKRRFVEISSSTSLSDIPNELFPDERVIDFEVETVIWNRL